jgi:hypothetical protein
MAYSLATAIRDYAYLKGMKNLKGSQASERRRDLTQAFPELPRGRDSSTISVNGVYRSYIFVGSKASLTTEPQPSDYSRENRNHSITGITNHLPLLHSGPTTHD